MSNKNLPHLVPIAETFETPNSLSSNATNNAVVFAVPISADVEQLSSSNASSASKTPGIKSLFVGCQKPAEKKVCLTPLETVKTIHIMKKKKPCKPKVVVPCKEPPKPVCVVPVPQCKPVEPKVCAPVCPPKQIVRVVNVDQNIPKNDLIPVVKTIYNTKCEPDPCVEEALKKKNNDPFDPLAALEHVDRTKPYDHCKNNPGDIYIIRGVGTVCDKNDIFSVNESSSFFKDVLGESPSEVNARQNEAMNFFSKQFGINFLGIAPLNGVYRTNDAQMYPYRLNPLIRSQVVLCAEGKVTNTQIHVYEGGFMVRILCNMRGGGQFAKEEGKEIFYKAGTMFFHGLTKMQKFKEVQKEVAVADPADPCKTQKHWETTWVATDQPGYVCFATEKPVESNDDQKIVVRAAQICTGENIKGYSKSIITWEDANKCQINVMVEEILTFGNPDDEKINPNKDW